MTLITITLLAFASILSIFGFVKFMDKKNDKKIIKIETIVTPQQNSTQQDSGVLRKSTYIAGGLAVTSAVAGGYYLYQKQKKGAFKEISKPFGGFKKLEKSLKSKENILKKPFKKTILQKISSIFKK